MPDTNRAIHGRLRPSARSSAFRSDSMAGACTRSFVLAKVSQKSAIEATAKSIIVRRKPSASSPPPSRFLRGVTNVPISHAAPNAHTKRYAETFTRSSDEGEMTPISAE